MLNHSLVINLPVAGVMDDATSQLRQEYQNYQQLLRAQPASVKQQLEAQAVSITEALDQQAAHIRYCLPDAVYTPSFGQGIKLTNLPAQFRKQSIGGLIYQLTHRDTISALLEQLSRLEKSPYIAVTNAARLIRHSLALYIVHSYLPGGADVQYPAEEEDDIPCIPVTYAIRDHWMKQRDSSTTPAIAGQEADEVENLNDSATSAEPVFFLPQWVVVDSQQRLIAEDISKAETIIGTMGRYLHMLNSAVRLAPYVVVDGEYQRKRYGILGQLVNQGRALARYEVLQICETIKRRAASHDLDRGFSLSLPYFNDQTLALELLNFDVVPPGRSMFIPSFLVLAVRAQGAKVIQETWFNRTTRVNLIRELYTLERAFIG